MDKQIILAVDDNGNFLRYIPKEAGHKGKGQRHLAITVLIFNSQNQVLLQRRKHQIFNNIWDFTGATHLLHRTNGTDEILEEATWRCLETEFDIKQKIPLKSLGFFNYFAKYGDYCENEYCHLMVGEYDGEIKMNPTVGYEYRWVKKQEFRKDIEANPKKYTSWAKEGTKVLEQNNFFQ